MSICFGGFCIPYSVFFPIILLILRPIITFVQNLIGRKQEQEINNKPKKEFQDSDGQVTSLSTEMSFRDIVNRDRVTVCTFVEICFNHHKY